MTSLESFGGANVIAEAGKYFGIFLIHGDKIVAGCTVVRNRATVRAYMISIVAPETARRIRMPEVVDISPPGNLHLRENISKINGLNRIDRVFDSGGVTL